MHTTSAKQIIRNAALMALGLFALPSITHAQTAPDEQIKTMTVAEGLNVTNFAREPMLFKPANIDVDANGRVWVSEGVNYRKWSNLREEGDRIVVLEDTTGSGKADKATTFYQGKDLACGLGICVLGDKVIVSDAPNVFLMTMKPDGTLDKKELLFTGISGVQHDHAVHKFVFGPDGKLYFNMGNAAERLKHPDGSPVVDMWGNEIDAGKRGSRKGNTEKVAYRQGMVLRMNMDGSELECIGNNFRNNFMVSVDSYGTLWQSDNDDDGNKGVRINYVMEYGNYGYGDEMTGAGWQVKRTNIEKEIPLRHWHLNDPGVVPNLLQTGAGSPTGICVYEGQLLPSIFQGQVIHCDAGPNVVRSYPTKDSGAGYSAEIVNVIKATDKWFRPSDVVVAPDGSLMVADWDDPGVGGHAMGDHTWPDMHGRIYRVAPPGTSYKLPAMDLSTADGAVEVLTSPNQARRYLAWTTLHAMGEKAEAPLQKLWKGTDPRLRARALWLLAKIDGKGRQYVSEAIKDTDSNIRIVGVRLARQLKLDIIPVLKQLASDPSPQVRRDVAIALRYNKSPEVPAIWAQLASQHDGKDRWYLEALGIGEYERDAECLAAYVAIVGDKWNTPGGRDIIWRSRGLNSLPLLQKIILEATTTDEERPRYIRALDFIPNGDEKADVLMAMLNSGIADKSVGIEALTRLKDQKSSKVPALAGIINKVLDEKKGTPDFVDLCEQLGVTDRNAELLQMAIDHPNDSAGVASVKLVIRNGDSALVAKSIAGPDGVKLVTAIGNSPDGAGEGHLAKILKDTAASHDLRVAAVRGMAKNNRGAKALLEMIRKDQLSPDARFLAGQELRGSGSKEVRDGVATLIPMPVNKDAKPLPPVAELVKIKGDLTNGHKMWFDTCSKCHAVGTEGTDFGPALSEIGTKLGKDAIASKLLQPNQGVVNGYEGRSIKLKDGTDVDGIITSETADEVTMKVPGGIVSKYKKSDIKSRHDMKISFMPEGLTAAMTTQDVADLLEYLASQKKK